ncbi:hypothetical protein F5148DRAFT_1293077 [Russula earlei]|uniref:Uncharacterized protein n=1 Tax=Russula earlei TaxID=71964 RepID=A0ACC0TUE8_9AGAM|nr:hypothetical protein F5148DRAFT_1293077 [Russula earlei]
MRTSFVFATFCLAIGVTPSFALPSNDIRTEPLEKQKLSKNPLPAPKLIIKSQEKPKPSARVGDSSDDEVKPSKQRGDLSEEQKKFLPYWDPPLIRQPLNQEVDRAIETNKRQSTTDLTEPSAGKPKRG